MIYVVYLENILYLDSEMRTVTEKYSARHHSYADDSTPEIYAHSLNPRSLPLHAKEFWWRQNLDGSEHTGTQRQQDRSNDHIVW